MAGRPQVSKKRVYDMLDSVVSHPDFSGRVELMPDGRVVIETGAAIEAAAPDPEDDLTLTEEEKAALANF